MENRQDLLEAARTIQSEGLEIGCPWDLKRKVFNLAKRELKKCGYKMQRCIEYIDWEEGGRLRPVVMEIAGETNYPHCIGVLGRWILDPTEPFALDRTRENLDLISGGHYVSTKWAMEVVPVEDVTCSAKNGTTEQDKNCRKRRRKT